MNDQIIFAQNEGTNANVVSPEPNFETLYGDAIEAPIGVSFRVDGLGVRAFQYAETEKSDEQKCADCALNGKPECDRFLCAGRDDKKDCVVVEIDATLETPKSDATENEGSAASTPEERKATPEERKATPEEIALAKRDKFIDLIAEKQAERQRELAREADAKEEARAAKKRAESLDSEIVELFLRGPDALQLDDSPLLTIAELAKEDGAAACKANGETNFEPSDDWRRFKVAEHFEVADAFFDKLNLDYDATVGELSDLLNELTSGRKKIKGVGPAFLEKISAMFDAFWESDAYRRLLRPVAASNDGEDDEKEVSFEEISEIVNEIIPAIDRRLSDPNDRWEEFDGTTYLDIRSKVIDEKKVPTRKQCAALRNILGGFEAANETNDETYDEIAF